VGNKRSSKGVTEIRKINRETILQEIWEHGAMSRIELSERTCLSPASITNIVEDLINEGILHEVGSRTSVVGRKPVLLDLNRKNLYSLAINIIELNRATVALVNFNYDIVQLCSIEQEEYNIILLLEKIWAEVDHLLKSVHKQNLVGIGVTAADHIDLDNCKLLFNTSLSSEPIRFLDALRYQYKLPVRLEDNLYSMAIAEVDNGIGNKWKNFLMINLSDTLSSSLIHDRQVVSGYIGEIGHLEVASHGLPCRCGEQGCLDTLASGWGVAQRILTESLLQPNGMAQAINISKTPIVDKIAKMALSGDAFSKRICQDAANGLSKAIRLLNKLLEIEGVILSSDRYQLWPVILKNLLSQGMGNQSIQISVSTMPNISLIGAAGISFHSWIGK
jgi:N-acetylglucosamine repressor